MLIAKCRDMLQHPCMHVWSLANASQCSIFLFSVLFRPFLQFVLLKSPVFFHPPQHAVNPIFPVSQYQIIEGGQQEIHLSAPVLTRPQTPAFNGSIEVDVTAEDLPSKDTRQNAEFCKHCFSLHCL